MRCGGEEAARDLQRLLEEDDARAHGDDSRIRYYTTDGCAGKGARELGEMHFPGFI